MERRWISIREAAQYLSLSEKTVYRLAGSVLPSVKIKGSLRIDKKRLDEELTSQIESLKS